MTPLVPGAELAGRYRLGRRLADDGVIETWTATDDVLARAVEVEVLEPGGEARAAFLAAAAGAARLMHPAIVDTYDTGQSVEGYLFVVTERAVGPTLVELLERHGPLPPERVVHIGRQLAHALDAAHRLDATHGAVGPATVQVADDDRAKLGGFTAGNLRARLAGAPADPRADVAACAATLVAALTGTFPGPDDTVASPRARRPGIPPELDAILVGAQRGDTITTAAGLAARLDALDLEDDARPDLDGRPTPPMGTRPVPPPRLATSRSGAVAGVVVGLLLAGAVAVAAFVLFGRGGTGGAPGSSEAGPTTTAGGGTSGVELTIVGGHSFDPFGDQTELEPRIPNLYDGNPSTVWSTEEYTTAKFGGLKAGVGAYVLLDASHPLERLTVTSSSRGWVFSVYVAPQPSSRLAGWGQPIAEGVTVSADITPVNLRGVAGRAVLIWITDLGLQLANPPQPATPYQVSIGELQIR